MIEALFNQPNYLAANKALDAVVLRENAIANNIANLETPGYKRVDLAPSFETELERAAASRDPQQINALQPTLAVDTTAVASSRMETRCIWKWNDANEPKRHDARAGNAVHQRDVLAGCRWPSPARILTIMIQILTGIQNTSAALTAEQTRLDVISQNIANAQHDARRGRQTVSAAGRRV